MIELFEVLWAIPLDKQAPHAEWLKCEKGFFFFFPERGKITWSKWLEIENLTRFEMLRENISLLMLDRLEGRRNSLCASVNMRALVGSSERNSRYKLQNYGRGPTRGRYDSNIRALHVCACRLWTYNLPATAAVTSQICCDTWYEWRLAVIDKHSSASTPHNRKTTLGSRLWEEYLKF